MRYEPATAYCTYPLRGPWITSRMSTPEEAAKKRQKHLQAAEWRGIFLNQCAALEHELSENIALFFCETEDRRLLFLSDVANDGFFTASKKRELVVRIAKRNYPSFYEGFKHVAEDLQDIFEIRNILAHASLNNDPQDNKDGLCFVYCKAGKVRKRVITDTELNDLRIRIKMCITSLEDMKKLYPYRDNAEKPE